MKTKALIIVATLVLLPLLFGCGSSDNNDSSPTPVSGEITTTTLQDEAGIEVFKSEDEAVLFVSGTDSATLILPRKAWVRGVAVPDFGVTDEEVTQFLASMSIKPNQLLDLLVKYELGIDDLLDMTKGYSGSWNEVDKTLDEIYVLEPSGGDNISDFFYFLDTANASMEDLDQALPKAGFTFDAFMDKMSQYEVNFGYLLDLYLASGAENLDEFLIVADETMARAVVTGGFYVTKTNLNYKKDGRIRTEPPYDSFQILNTGDTNPLKYVRHQENSKNYQFFRGQGVDYLKVPFAAQCDYQLKHNTLAGNYVKGNFGNFRVEQHGGFGILEVAAYVGSPYNGGTASEPAPVSHVVIRLKTKWWNYVNLQSFEFQFSGKDGVRFIN